MFLQPLKLRCEPLASSTFRLVFAVFVHDSRKLNSIHKMRNPIKSGNQLPQKLNQRANGQQGSHSDWSGGLCCVSRGNRHKSILIGISLLMISFGL